MRIEELKLACEHIADWMDENDCPEDVLIMLGVLGAMIEYYETNSSAFNYGVVCGTIDGWCNSPS